MRCLLTGILILGISTSASAQDTKTHSKTGKDSPEKMITAGIVTGKVVTWDAKKKSSITLEVPYDVPNPSAIETEAKLEAQMAQVQANPRIGAADRINRITDLNRQIAQNKTHLTKQEKTKIEFQLADSVNYRRAELPTKTEDGKVKKYTEKEKRELKGPNPKLPGYTAAEEDVHTNLTVTVYLQKKKEAKPSKDKNAPPPPVTMILIMKEPAKDADK